MKALGKFVLFLLAIAGTGVVAKYVTEIILNNKKSYFDIGE